MKIQNKTVLITGGGSGIGYEIARLLSRQHNQVIIIGRNEAKLKQAASTLPNVVPIVCDITSGQEVKLLAVQLRQQFPYLSVLINNAGKAFKYEHGAKADAYDKARQELDTNYLSVIRLTELLLPLMQEQPEAAIVNVSSIVGLSPSAVIPTYSDSKAALHSYTLSLRKTLAAASNIKVFELMPPTVNTAFSAEIGGALYGIPAAEVAEALVSGMEQDEWEIGVGGTIPFATAFFAQRHKAFDAMNEAR